MNRLIASALAITLITSGQLFAQEDKKVIEERVTTGRKAAGRVQKGSETEEIIIRKKGDKDINITVEIKGDKIMVNGKPLAEFREDGITINKRIMRILGNNNLRYQLKGDVENGLNEDMMQGWNGDNFHFWNDDSSREQKTTFLGVTTEDAEEGAKIAEVSKGSAAEKAGLKEDDIITKIGSTKIDGPSALSDAIKAKKPKEEVTITYKRDGKENTVKTTLGERVQKNIRLFSMNGADNGGMNFNGRGFKTPGPSERRLMGIAGVPGADLNGNFDAQEFAFSFNGRPKLGLKIQDLEEGDGVKVIDVEKETAAEKAGLKKDDIITEIGGKKVKNTDDAREEFSPEPGKTAYSIKAKRNGTEMNFEVKVPKKIKTASF
jgi:serine protease Do